jgi:hypothetical protein
MPRLWTYSLSIAAVPLAVVGIVILVGAGTNAYLVGIGVGGPGKVLIVNYAVAITAVGVGSWLFNRRLTPKQHVVDTNRPWFVWRVVGAFALPFLFIGVFATLAELRIHISGYVGFAGVPLGAVLLSTLPSRWWLRVILVMIYTPVAFFLALYFALII